MMIVYLVRHGMSNANEHKLVTGTPEDALSNEGRSQSYQLSLWLKKAKISADRYVASQWLRAQQTALCIWPKNDWEFDERVGETNAGDVANWPLNEFKNKYPDFYKSPFNCYPNGESHCDLNRRIIGWLHEQFRNPCNSLALIAHSGPITCILQHILGLDMSVFPAFLPPHASMSVAEIVFKNNRLIGKLLAFSLGPLANLQKMLYIEK